MADYSAVILNIRVNERRAGRLQDVGVKLNARTRAREEEIMVRQIDAAPKVNAFRHGVREDAAGNIRGDTGKPVFGWAGAKHEAISLSQIRNDLGVAGYVLVSINLVRKEGDKSSKLYLRFEPSPAAEAFQTWESMERELTGILNGVYGTLHAYRNPDGTCTVNPSQSIPQEQLTGKEIRVLRMSAEGNFRCMKGGEAQEVVQADEFSNRIANLDPLGRKGGIHIAGLEPTGGRDVEVVDTDGNVHKFRAHPTH